MFGFAQNKVCIQTKKPRWWSIEDRNRYHPSWFSGFHWLCHENANAMQLLAIINFRSYRTLVCNLISIFLWLFFKNKNRLMFGCRKHSLFLSHSHATFNLKRTTNICMNCTQQEQISLSISHQVWSVFAGWSAPKNAINFKWVIWVLRR